MNCTVRRDGEVIAAGTSAPTFAPDLGYHYGSVVPSLRAGDAIELDVWTPPQLARHRGYETAFVQMDPVEFRL